MKKVLFICMFFCCGIFHCIAQGPDLILPVGHTNSIESIAFSPDSKYIVTGGNDNTAKIWEAASGKFLFNFSGHKQIISASNFSPDGKLIVTASWDSTIGIWDAATGKSLRLFKAHSDVVSFADFSPDGKYIVSASWDHSAKIWEVSTGNLVHSLVGHDDRINYAGFSADGKFLVTSASFPNMTIDSSVKIWEVATGRLLTTFKSRRSPYMEVNLRSARDSFINTTDPSDYWLRHSRQKIPYYQTFDSASVSPDGKSVITILKNNTIKVWETSSRKLLYSLKGYTAKVTAANFTPDGKSVIAIFADGSAKIWSMFSGRLTAGLSKFTYKADSVNFSRDGKLLLTVSGDDSVKICGGSTGKTMHYLKTHSHITTLPDFSPDENFLIIRLDDGSVEIWNSVTGGLSYRLPVFAPVRYAGFSVDGQYVTTESGDNIVNVWQASTGALLDSLKEYSPHTAILSSDNKYIVTDDNKAGTPAIPGKNNLLFQVSGYISEKFVASFSPGDEFVVTANGDTVKVGAALKGSFIFSQKILAGFAAGFSPDRRYFVIANGNVAKVWNAADGAFLADLTGHTNEMYSADFSHDGKYFVTPSSDNSAKIWELSTGKMTRSIKSSKVALFSPDSTYIVTSPRRDTLTMWNASSGDSLYSFRAESVKFSPDGRYVVMSSWENTLKIIDVNTGQTLHVIKRDTYLTVLNFSTDGTLFITAPCRPGEMSNRYLLIWKTATGELVDSIRAHSTQAAVFSPDGKYVATVTPLILQIWKIFTADPLHQTSGIGNAFFSADGKYVVGSSGSIFENIFDTTATRVIRLEGYSGIMKSVSFSSGGKYIAVISYVDNWYNLSSVKIFEAATGKIMHSLEGHSGVVKSANFSPDGKYVLTASDDNTVKTWDVLTGKLLYTLIAVDSTEYLAIDTAGHFDGTAEARKLLYFTCGTEIIQLDQLKDQLWVPDLVENIMSGKSIHTTRLSDMNICSLTPTVETIDEKNAYRFRISPRRGGLGETVLYVNNIEVQRYQSGQLGKSDSGYELTINPENLRPLFIQGRENHVSVKAYTVQNDISSRGAEIIQKETSKQITPANLYAVMIGVSDYKGDEIDLRYPGKDATDISNAIGASARKFLDTDSSEHVFLYKLTTDKNHDRYPDKNSIKNVLQEIGKKATANDILFIFFAGHGVMDGQQKRFYFLTADASSVSAMENAGISTDELGEWMKPANIKAQKRILIFDACQSGEAIKDFVKVGQEGQEYLAARNDDRAQQIKALDNLNDKYGLFIIAASASNQSAYEMGRYSQGLLTYALLKAIKQQPDILEDGKYLNISRWFNAAGKTVSDLVRQTGARQDPQVVSTSNINIGIVDSSVISGIVLSQEKPLFTGSNFQNGDDNIIDDDLRLSEYVNQSFSAISSRGTDSISYVIGTSSTDAWSLLGRYTVTNESLAVTVKIKQNKRPVYSFEINGNKGSIQNLGERIAKMSIQWVMTNKTK